MTKWLNNNRITHQNEPCIWQLLFTSLTVISSQSPPPPAWIPATASDSFPHSCSNSITAVIVSDRMYIRPCYSVQDTPMTFHDAQNKIQTPCYDLKALQDLVPGYFSNLTSWHYFPHCAPAALAFLLFLHDAKWGRILQPVELVFPFPGTFCLMFCMTPSLASWRFLTKCYLFQQPSLIVHPKELSPPPPTTACLSLSHFTLLTWVHRPWFLFVGLLIYHLSPLLEYKFS